MSKYVDKVTGLKLMTATVYFSGTLPAIILFAFNVFDKPVFLLAGHIVEDGQCEDLWTGHWL